MSLQIADLYATTEATWPPARAWRAGPWMLRDGQGGGKRVSAATAEAEFSDADIPEAEAAMRRMGEVPLFMIRAGEAALDAMLEARGYSVIDPVNVYVAPISALTTEPIPRVTTFCIWEPLAIMLEIWAQGAIGPARIAVMARARTRTGILARWNEKPAGVAFAAVANRICMVHAVEVLPHQRKQGVARWIMRQAAFWGASQGAETLAVLCTRANTGANALYSSLGFTVAGQYHYRVSQD
ncbi:GNAT family N-acetyltransferase [Sulfitobacter sp. D35]|uniref:GNAT family N-acetyltransferase n=1 Tax=Sulfitobacter sp. D35 TaxID=3083252 RepID=UPI00296EA11A|nr:GNAT family N-acetyltransferase [Sulfitobacter sp. D35]MDW4500149.1 GNAT family N-acetyltransferase [Sulfitobacter sp. D35]